MITGCYVVCFSCQEGLLHRDAHVGFRIAEHQAAGFGEHEGIHIAHAAGFEVERFGAEGNVAVFLEVFRVNHHSVVGHAHFIKHLAE